MMGGVLLKNQVFFSALPNASLSFQSLGNAIISSAQNWKDLSKNVFSFSAWIYRTDTGRMILFSKGTDFAKYDMHLEFDPFGRLVYSSTHQETSCRFITANVYIQKFVWQHIYIEYNLFAQPEQRISIYVDGIKLNNYAVQEYPSGSLLYTNASYRYGVRSDDSYPLKGCMYQPTWYSDINIGVNNLRDKIGKPMPIIKLPNLYSCITTNIGQPLTHDSGQYVTWNARNMQISSLTPN